MLRQTGSAACPALGTMAVAQRAGGENWCAAEKMNLPTATDRRPSAAAAELLGLEEEADRLHLGRRQFLDLGRHVSLLRLPDLNSASACNVVGMWPA
jgi:hypothetical protein